MSNFRHHAAFLEIGDRCFATLRHPTDGKQNKIMVECIVVANYEHASKIRVAHEGVEYDVPYNEIVNEKNHLGVKIGDKILRRNGSDRKPEWVETTVNITYLSHLTHFPDDYRLPGTEMNPMMVCEICTHKWVAVFPEGTKELECPNCHQMTILR